VVIAVGKTCARSPTLSSRHSLQLPAEPGDSRAHDAGRSSKLSGLYASSPTSRATLTDKLELYFTDYSFLPLFVHENYLKATQFARANRADSPQEKELLTRELASKAADSISDGDLVDRMIHGSQQKWSLMPAHGILSCVRPMYHVYGQGGGFPAVPLDPRPQRDPPELLPDARRPHVHASPHPVSSWTSTSSPRRSGTLSSSLASARAMARRSSGSSTRRPKTGSLAPTTKATTPSRTTKAPHQARQSRSSAAASLMPQQQRTTVVSEDNCTKLEEKWRD